jgi:hypothetical protein
MGRYLKSFIVQTGKDILIRFPKKVLMFGTFIKEFNQFKSRNDRRFSVTTSDMYPCLKDKVSTTPFDHHYIYHPAWAARILGKTKPKEHIDFSSILSFSSIVSAFVPITFYDYRPAELNLSGWKGGAADLCNLSIADNSFESVSCMHTVEHIGLGRYGDSIDPQGDIKAINELKRITKPNGDILFVTPVGKQKIEFNAHRIYSYELVLELFEGCTLQSFSLVPDEGGIIDNANPGLVAQQTYACGCFWFKKNI